MPVFLLEVMARKGKDNLRFGPMRPVGLPIRNRDRYPMQWSSCGRITEGTMFSMVGFQTRMKWENRNGY